MAPRLPDRQPELTARHREVARLVAEGRTNGQIGDELDISLDGAKYHVTQLLMRLGLERREQIAEWYRGEQRWSVRRLAPAALAGVGTLAGRVAVAGALVVAVAIAALIVATEVRNADETTLIGTLVALPEIPVRPGHTATLLADGRVLLAGGSGPEGPVRAALVFDPATRTFTPTGLMVEGRTGHTATLLGDGRVLIAGGARYDPATIPLRTAEVFDPVTGLFTPTGPMTIARAQSTAAVLPDGRVLVVGGRREMYSNETSADMYDPSTGEFEATGPLYGRSWGELTPMPDGRVVAIGDGKIARYDVPTGVFRFTVDAPVIAGTAVAVTLADGTVLVAGGFDRATLPAPLPTSADGSPQVPELGASPDAYLLNVETGDAFLTGAMAQARARHIAVPLPDGRALVVGGMSGFPAVPADPGEDLGAEWAKLAVTSVEIYDPERGQFQAAGNLDSAGLIGSATLLRDGSVLIVGSSADGETNAWLYRP